MLISKIEPPLLTVGNETLVCKIPHSEEN